MNPLDRLETYDYPLPAHLIADRPLVPRTRARLLRITQTGLVDHTIADLADLLDPGDLMVVNDTKVIPARLYGVRGAVPIEVQLNRPLGPDAWRAFARPGKRLKLGDTITFADIHATVRAKADDGLVDLGFSVGGAALDHAIERLGLMPLPPYLKRRPDDQDRRDYQTRFAREPGSVAAPTAGLHLADDVLAALTARGVQRAAVTLHVGAGTFLPVKTDDVRDHRMHAEFGRLLPETADAIAETRARGGRIIAVGTTALRVLEASGGAPFAGDIDLFIRPGYTFRVVDRLLTNFHLPKSTLVMLVAALAGLPRIQAAYAHAIARGYRFFSYGDACLIDRMSP